MAFLFSMFKTDPEKAQRDFEKAGRVIADINDDYEIPLTPAQQADVLKMIQNGASTRDIEDRFKKQYIINVEDQYRDRYPSLIPLIPPMIDFLTLRRLEDALQTISNKLGTLSPEESSQFRRDLDDLAHEWRTLDLPEESLLNDANTVRDISKNVISIRTWFNDHINESTPNFREIQGIWDELVQQITNCGASTFLFYRLNVIIRRVMEARR